MKDEPKAGYVSIGSGLLLRQEVFDESDISFDRPPGRQGVDCTIKFSHLPSIYQQRWSRAKNEHTRNVRHSSVDRDHFDGLLNDAGLFLQLDQGNELLQNLSDNDGVFSADLLCRYNVTDRYGGGTRPQAAISGRITLNSKHVTLRLKNSASAAVKSRYSGIRGEDPIEILGQPIEPDLAFDSSATTAPMNKQKESLAHRKAITQNDLMALVENFRGVNDNSEKLRLGVFVASLRVVLAELEQVQGGLRDDVSFSSVEKVIEEGSFFCGEGD